MAKKVDRSPRARATRIPHVFLSHSSKDKKFVLKLVRDLNRLGIDAWLDTWELLVGDDLFATVSGALERSQYVAIIISEHFLKSKWANDEMRQTLARENRIGRTIVLPILIGKATPPSFIESRLYLDFRTDYFTALTRLAGMIHKISKMRLEQAINKLRPKKIADVVKALEYAGHRDYSLFDSHDYNEILKLSGWERNGFVWFDPDELAKDSRASAHLRSLMKELSEE